MNYIINSKSKRRKIFIITIISIIVVLLGILTFYKIVLEKDKLEGNWTIDNITKYEFNGKGKGKLKLPTIQSEFTYKIEDDKILINFVNENSRDSSYKFSIKDNTLTLVGIEQTTGTYNLIKQ